MVNTGIKKYDNLPARVDLMDIDFMRFKFNEYKSKIKSLKLAFKEAIKIIKRRKIKDVKIKKRSN